MVGTTGIYFIQYIEIIEQSNNYILYIFIVCHIYVTQNIHVSFSNLNIIQSANFAYSKLLTEKFEPQGLQKTN